MVKKYVYGNPFETEAVVTDISPETDAPAYGTVSVNDDGSFSYTYKLAAKDRVYGLGENVRGINKRGFEYISNCTDQPKHHEDTKSLYGAHNFLIVDGETRFGLFFDYPSTMTFDVAYRTKDNLVITCDRSDLYLYVITGDSDLDIVKQFRKIIGRSYIAPKFAFGFGQSRWGYRTKEDFRKVVNEHRSKHIPLDMVYMDIDYMEDFKDFTINPDEFADFPDFVKEMREQNIHLVPIIDAGVKIEEGYDVYEEGIEKGYFCKRADGSEFVAAVWPGETHFPDFLNPDARRWFGDKYKILLDMGIDGFWNDMNEPAIFYTPEGLENAKKLIKDFNDNPDDTPAFDVLCSLEGLANNPEDYKSFYHNVNGKKICHADVHNLFGYNMTRAAGEAFERIRPDERVLMFSRSSYVGMHRYGGIWMGDNLSWWSHLLMNLKMLPSLNMIGILYTGADIGGFGSDTSRDLVLRWLALGVFTPLMRNHSAKGTREQEFYQFEDASDFESVISVRYRLIPYIYSEYMKAALDDEMMFKPLAFAYPDDGIAVQIEDQMMLGNEVMITPVYTQNAQGRFVYLPEDMMFVKFMGDGSIYTEKMEKGSHYISVTLNEVPLFIRENKCIPLATKAESTADIDEDNLTLIGYDGAEYRLYNDDGIHKDYDNKSHYSTLKK